MKLVSSCLSFLRRFRKETLGTATVEFAIFIPVLFWGYGASYVFFDGYRQSSINLKAAYTIGDLISRETAFITPTYIDSMYSLTQILIRPTNPVSLRVTVIRWDEEDDQYYLDWSEARSPGDTLDPLTQAQIMDLEARLPVMPDEERVILVETWNSWEGIMETGLGPQSLDNFIFTSPRFATQVRFQDDA